jgi:hypothetical protein
MENQMKVKSIKEVLEAEKYFDDLMWYERHMDLRDQVESGVEKVQPDIWKKALEAARQIEEKYGKEKLGPFDDFEWGLINGKLSALRWMIGYEWDELDT